METIQHYMTAHPHLIGRAHTLSEAHQMMREHKVRCLPVTDGDELVGVVSLHDLHLIETLDGVDPDVVTVEEAMTREPFTVGPLCAVEDVAHQMAERGYGSALVVDRGRVIGVFSRTDALRALVTISARCSVPVVGGAAFLTARKTREIPAIS